MAKVMEIKDLVERTVGMTVRPLPEEIRDAVTWHDRNVLIGDPDGELGESEKVPAVDIREIRCEDGTVRLLISDYRAKHQFAGILENETVMLEEVAKKKAEILAKMERMEEKLANPDFDDIIHETDDSLSGGLKIAHDMNGKAGTTGAQYCFLFRRIHSLLDGIQSDRRLAGVMETLKDYDVKHGKILEWEETAEGWKNGYMTIPDDDAVVKGWGVSKPYQMRMFCETAKREVIFEVMRHLEEFEPKEQRKIARLAFSETAKRTYGDVDIHFQEEPSSIVVRMASPQEYIFSCILYGTGEWSYPDTSIREAFEDAAMFYKNISEKQEHVTRTTDVKVLYEVAQGLKQSVADGLIPENYYNRFVRISGDILRRADSLAEGSAGYQLYNEYAKRTGFDLSDYSCPKRKEHVSAVLELMDKTFALFPELRQSEKMYSFYSGRTERVSEEKDYGRQVIPGGRG